MSHPAQPTDQTTAIALVLDHNHGTDVTIHRTHNGALAKVDQFVENWWADEMGDTPMPEDKAQARQMYFDEVEHETYVIVDAALMD